MSETRHSNAAPEDERRDHGGMYSVITEFGRTRGWVTCPFCSAKVLCYLWSLAGSGKRCSCGALITQIAAYKKASV